MSNVGYDLDTSGGLMPLIRALIKPPDDDNNGIKSRKPQHPYYKRPGKGHNHDSCDACGEGGDLICCDRCPASFHLDCHDPPLDEKDIPVGQWLCNECRSSDAEKASSSRSSRAQSPADSKAESDKKTRSLRNSHTNSTQSSKKKNTKDVKEESESASLEKKIEDKNLTPLQLLAKAAKVMNPKQFELPREMRIPIVFPGTEKEGSNGNGGSSSISVDSLGCVPLPAKHCFVCQATCKMAPLLQCDYCPLLYHQDCLDPPLTALPTGRWMCPNHVEQYIDWKLVNSISVTERVALWDKFSGPVDQHAIKIDFIRRARSARPAFRIKVPVGIRGRVIVPDMVKYHYDNPLPLMPSRREYVRCKNVLKQLKISEDYNESDDDTQKKQLICLNLTCPKYTGDGTCPHESPQLKGVSATDAASDLLAINDVKLMESMTESSDDSDFNDNYSLPIKRRKRGYDDETPAKRKSDGKAEQRLELRVEGSDAEELLAIAEEQLNKLDERLVKLLAWQRLQQVLVGERCIGLWRRAPLTARAEELVLRSIDRNKLTRYGFKHVALPSELLSREDHERIARTVWGSPIEDHRVSPPLSPGHSLSDATVRATLCPVERPASYGLGDGLGRPIPMRLSRLSIGWDSGCDVVLSKYGKCHYTSRLHALVFYDDVSHHFELINYSEWGTCVNGALYTCDVTNTGVAVDQPAAAGTPGEDVENRAAAVRSIARRHLSKRPRLNGDLTKWNESLCQCPPTRERPVGCAWEGSALLQHGSLLQFGCLMFVFSITDAPGFPESEPVEGADLMTE